MVKCASIVLGLLIGILFVSFYVSTFNDGRLRKIEMIVNSPQRECWEGETVQHSIELTNQTGRVQVVERFYKSCGCSSLSIEGKDVEEDGFVLPPLATIVLKALVKTEGRVGVFAPSVGLQLTGQEFDAIESVVLPVLVRRGMQLVPPAIHFSFDDESESAVPIVVSVDLCDNLADGISRIELDPLIANTVALGHHIAHSSQAT